MNYNPVKCTHCGSSLNNRICCIARSYDLGNVYRKLYDQGETVRSIASYMNISYGKVHRLLKLVGTNFRKK